MKKKKLKNLNLNKRAISSFESKVTIAGGTNGSCFANCFDFSKAGLCPPTIASLIDENGCMSENGCTTGDDATMTCVDWSCGCV